jgi:serine/threonine-protein kinase
LVYIGARDGTLYAVDATSGDQRWTAATGGSIDSSAAVAGGVVYVGCSDQAQGQVCCGSLFAFNATNGARLWTGGTGGSIDEPPTVLDEPMVVRSNNRGGLRFLLGAVYVGSGSQVSQFALP